MTKIEIQKLLYKQKPRATFLKLQSNNLYYQVDINIDNSREAIIFIIPVDDIGEAAFLPTMDAKLLGRWIATKL